MVRNGRTILLQALIGMAVFFGAGLARAQTDYADALETLAGLQNGNKGDLRLALAALRRAQQDDPYNPHVAGLMKTIEKALEAP